MARTLSGTVDGLVDDTITAPYYLVHMGFSSPVGGYNLSTRDDETVDAVAYSGGRLKGDGIRLNTGKTGDITGSITIDNSDNAWSTIVLGESPSGLDCKVYKVYGSSPAVGDLIMLFDGHMDKAEVSGSTVKIDIKSTGSQILSPGLVIAKPYFNWLPPAGTTIVTGNVTITLDKAS